MTSVLIAAVVVAGLLASAASFITYRLLNKSLIQIHTLVNSNLTKVQADLKIAQERIAVLERHLAIESEGTA